jgi:transcription antitermination factor NusG
MTSNALLWFALAAKPRHEKSVAQILSNKGLESFLPLYRVHHRWTDRLKAVDLPLFPGYVFCRFDYEHRLAVRATPGVSSIIGFDSSPTPVLAEEIARVRAIVSSGLPAQPWPHLHVGEAVLIDRGSLTGLTGILVREKDSLRVVVNVDLLNRSVAVEIDRDMICVAPGLPANSNRGPMSTVEPKSQVSTYRHRTV